MFGRSTFVRTTAAVTPAPVAPRCPDGSPHHWRVDAMWDHPEDARHERVREVCRSCGVIKYVPRYFEPNWSKSLPGTGRKRRFQRSEETTYIGDEEHVELADLTQEVW